MARVCKFRAAWWPLLKRIGYDVIPIDGKDSPRKGWPRMPNDEAAISHWSGAGAAIRMKGSDLLVIDLDVHVASMRDQMIGWMIKHHPEFMATCLRRHSEAVTLALIGRTVTAKGTTRTARFVGEGTDPKGDFVEVFNGNCKNYIGVAGRHCAGREYDYYGRHITETPVDQLPWLADSNIAPMVVAFEAIMADCGWQKVVPAIGEAARGTKIFDLEPDQVFTLSDGETVTLKDLEGFAQSGIGCGRRGEEPLRGYADLWDPSTGRGPYSNTRVLVTYGAEGLCLYDCKTNLRHRWKSCAPMPDAIGEKPKEMLKALHDQHQAEVRS